MQLVTLIKGNQLKKPARFAESTSSRIEPTKVDNSPFCSRLDASNKPFHQVSLLTRSLKSCANGAMSCEMLAFSKALM